jgi:hypothetical protein
VIASGERHHSWRGDAAGYTAIHLWVGKHFTKTGRCEACGGEGRTEWANTDHTYRRERADWREMCHACHMKQDRPASPRRKPITVRYRGRVGSDATVTGLVAYLGRRLDVLNAEREAL